MTAPKLSNFFEYIHECQKIYNVKESLKETWLIPKNN